MKKKVLLLSDTIVPNSTQNNFDSGAVHLDYTSCAREIAMIPSFYRSPVPAATVVAGRYNFGPGRD
jgi:hypothetical protein